MSLIDKIVISIIAIPVVISFVAMILGLRDRNKTTKNKKVKT